MTRITRSLIVPHQAQSRQMHAGRGWLEVTRTHAVETPRYTMPTWCGHLAPHHLYEALGAGRRQSADSRAVCNGRCRPVPVSPSAMTTAGSRR